MSEKNPTNNIPVEENESFDLYGVISKYLQNWYWFVLSIIIFLSIGFVYVIFQTPLYQIEGKLLIKENVKQGNAAGSTASSLNGFDLFSSDKVLENEIELLKSNTFLESTVRQLNLQVNVLFKEGLIKVDLYADPPVKVQVVNPNPKAFIDYISIYPQSANDFMLDGKKYPFNNVIYTPYGSFLIRPGKSLYKYIGKRLFLKVNDLDDVVDGYNGNLSVEAASSQGTILLISLKDAVPQRGRDFINKLIEVYNINSIKDKNLMTANSLAFIEGRIDSIASDLSGVEKKVERYKSSNNITDISSQSRIYLENQQQNDAALNKVLIQLNVLQGLKTYLSGGQDAGLPSTLGLDDPTLTGLVKQLADVLNNKQSLLRTIPEDNPIIQSLNDQISSLKKSIYAGVENIRSGLEITRTRLQAKSNQYESSIQTVPVKERGLIDVMRQQEIKNNLFIYLLEKREETSLALASNISGSRIVDLPRSSRHPVSPKKSIIYLVFTFLGFVFPALVIFIRDVLNYKVASRLDIEKITSVPVVAEISYSRDKTVLASVERPRSLIAEQIRALRTNIGLFNGTEQYKTLLFTSSISGEGKSFVSLNIGSSFASIGKKVLIIELDLRKPKLHHNLGIVSQPGLSDYLNGDLDYKRIIQPVKQQEGYFIIASGTLPDNPAELLNSTRLDSLIATLKTEFDYIILDAPPVGLVTDAQILEKYADATMFIVRYKYSLKSDIQALQRYYQDHKFKNMSIIFNAVGADRRGYGTGYGYYEEAEAKKNIFQRVWPGSKNLAR
jgi:capsular exopolysaccharide synthesis family protein